MLCASLCFWWFFARPGTIYLFMCVPGFVFVDNLFDTRKHFFVRRILPYYYYRGGIFNLALGLCLSFQAFREAFFLLSRNTLPNTITKIVYIKRELSCWQAFLALRPAVFHKPPRLNALSIVHEAPAGSKIMWFCKMGEIRSASVLCCQMMIQHGKTLKCLDQTKSIIETARKGARIEKSFSHGHISYETIKDIICVCA